MSATLRALAAADLPAAHAITAGLRWPHRLEDWAMLLRLGEGVAIEEDGALIGTGLWWPHGPRHATVGMVLVAPERQGKGLGRRIMRALLDEAAPRALMLNATAAGLPLYAALGFAPAGDIHQVQGVWSGAPARAAGLRQAGAADLATLVALDAAAFGAPAPASLAALLDAGTALIAEDRTAFAVARRFGRGTVIGPVVAPDAAAAIGLVMALAQPGAFTRLDLTGHAVSLAGVLERHGLARVDTVTAMTTGRWEHTPPPLRFALVSQALG